MRSCLVVVVDDNVDDDSKPADEVVSAGCDAVLIGRNAEIGGRRCRNGLAPTSVDVDVDVDDDAPASGAPARLPCMFVDDDSGVPRGEWGDRAPEGEGEADVGDVDSEDEAEKLSSSSQPPRSASRCAEKATNEARSAPTSAVNSVSSNPREYTCVSACRVVSCRVVSCRVVSCRVVSCRVVSCRWS
jgi:hypothetical protein